MHPHAAKLRVARVSIPGQIYLLTTVTAVRQPLFADWQMGRLLVHCLREQLVRAETLAFVVMPDHLHWLVSLREGSLSALMQQMKAQSALRINAARAGSGAIWQRGFHDHALRRDEDLVAAARYVIANPVRAGLVQRVGDYPFWDAVWL
jgi:putative transposase